MPESAASLQAGKNEYEKTFGPEHGKKVLADLRWYAYAEPGDAANREQGCALFHAEAVEMGRRIGRYELYQRIIHYLSVTDEEIDAARDEFVQQLGLAEMQETPGYDGRTDD